MGNKASLSYCSVCYDGRYYSEDLMSDDLDAIIRKDRDENAAKQQQRMTIMMQDLQPDYHARAMTGRSGSIGNDCESVRGFHRRRLATEDQVLKQLSFSSHLSMEGRELCINKRATSICEREDVEDDVVMQRSESVLFLEAGSNDAVDNDDLDAISESRFPSD
ncbi:hypothetical protein MPSEU_000883100 [Mayamaea pseudoterrestris]|nr:hypothetical protein MPSEU_000883100 [Mayamaea pseudoterrestris]